MEAFEEAPSEGAENSAAEVARRRRIVFFSLGACLFAGLALALLYLAGRVLETRAVVAGPAVRKPPIAVAAKPALIAAPAGAVAIRVEPAQGYAGPVIRPNPGETYLQVGAFGPSFTQGFLDRLARQHFRPVVAQSPQSNVFRILIGPLNRGRNLRLCMRQLNQAGLQFMVQRY